MGTKISSNQDFYKEHYKKRYVRCEKEKQASYLLSSLRGLYFQRGKKVLDVGCGIGTLGKEIKRRNSPYVYGIDISEVGIKYARSEGIKAKIADIEDKWPFGNDFFDTIVSVQVLEHLINPDHFFMETRRVLKKNGIVIITTPNLAAWFNRIIFLLGYQPFFNEVSMIDKTLGLGFSRRLTTNRNPLGHIHVFTLRALEDILKFHKFRIMEKKGGRVGYFPRYINLLDGLFSKFPSLATDLIIVAKKI